MRKISSYELGVRVEGGFSGQITSLGFMEEASLDGKLILQIVLNTFFILGNMVVALSWEGKWSRTTNLNIQPELQWKGFFFCFIYFFLLQKAFIYKFKLFVTELKHKYLAFSLV